jgi:pimeloyl-ACP methyl ester carboxylesterase
VTDGLLLIHGFPLDGSQWDEQVEALAGPLPAIAPSLPGFGGTDGAGEIMSMSAAAGRCVEALDSAGLERAVVCGLSMGGYVALEMWRSAPGRISSMVLANTRAGADDEAGKQRRRALAERVLSEGTAGLVEEPGPLLSGEADDALWARVRAIIAAQPAEAIAAAALGMAERADSTADLPSIDVPVLVVVSTGDTLIPQDAGREMASAIPASRLEVIDGAGHLCNMEAPAEFTRLLRDHVERVVGT